MKLLKNKTAIGIIAIFMGILICFIFTPLYNQQLESKTKVVTVVKKITKGKQITEDYVKVMEIGSFNLPDDVITKEDMVIGKYAVTDMYPDDHFIPEKLSETPLSNNEYLENLDGSEGAISVTVQSFAAGLSGKLLSGDIVSIIRTTDTTTEIPPELKYVKVLACTTKNGDDVDADTISKDSEEDEKIASTVTLLVNDEQAKVLAEMETEGNIHIELVYRGLEEDCNKFLEQQKKIIEEMSLSSSDMKDTVNENDMTDSNLNDIENESIDEITNGQAGDKSE